MNHVKWAFAILTIILAVSIFSEYAVRSECNELTCMLYDLKDAAEIDDKKKASELCIMVNDKWNSVEKLISYTVPFDKICQAQQSICRLLPLLESDSEEFEAEVMTAAVLCSNIY